LDKNARYKRIVELLYAKKDRRVVLQLGRLRVGQGRGKRREKKVRKTFAANKGGFVQVLVLFLAMFIS
jgi:hypothetical protein